jgi:hypothetical protein
MRRMRLTLATLALLLAVTGAGLALAATPKKGGLYSGQKDLGTTKKVVVRVSKSGKNVLARLYCDKRGVGALKAAVKGGRFSARRETSGTLLWAIKGHFTSKKSLRVKLTVLALCDGTGGSLTLKAK